MTTGAKDGGGDANFTATFPDTVPPGQFITATATDPNGDTSEFSGCVQVAAAPPPPVGGTIVPTDKLGLVMPWIMAAALIVLAGVSLAVWNRKRGTDRAAGR